MTRAIGGAIVAGATVLLLCILISALAGCDGRDKFARDCHKRGGVVSETHRGGSTSKTCVPPPQPNPVGWQ